MKKAIWIFILVVLAGLAGFIYYKYFFPFGEGVKAGELNYMVRKGVIFKTYEGKLIQSGFRSAGKTPGTAIQSYEFEFSVKEKSIAEKLMLSGGKDMELRYIEYKGTLPWRGFSKYIVTEIVAIEDKKPDSTAILPDN